MEMCYEILVHEKRVTQRESSHFVTPYDILGSMVALMGMFFFTPVSVVLNIFLKI